MEHSFRALGLERASRQMCEIADRIEKIDAGSALMLRADARRLVSCARYERRCGEKQREHLISFTSPPCIDVYERGEKTAELTWNNGLTCLVTVVMMVSMKLNVF